MMEICSVASDGKSIASMPDVCYTPPQAPPTPTGVPIPYPNTGMASDLTGGSTTVMIGGKPACLKDKSSFSKTSGDEAGSAPLKGLITMKNAGALFFAAWSMDVKIEGENVVRNMDMGTHNHGSVPGNTGPWPFLASMTGPVPPGQPPGPCSKEKEKEDTACSGKETKADRCADPACREAMRCDLQPYSRTKTKTMGCCEGQTPHHLIEVHSFTPPGGRKKKQRLEEFKNYDDGKAPCVCCDESARDKGDHGRMHAVQGVWERAHMSPTGKRSQMPATGEAGDWTYGEAKLGGITALQNTFPNSKCSGECIAAQLDAYHSQVGVNDDTPIRADRSPLTEDQEEDGGEIVAQILPSEEQC